MTVELTVSDAYECDWCHTAELWTCRCWEAEAAKYRVELVEVVR